jgi:hypothetical protein
METQVRIVQLISEQNRLLERIAAALERMAEPTAEAPEPEQSGPVVRVPT